MNIYLVGPHLRVDFPACLSHRTSKARGRLRDQRKEVRAVVRGVYFGETSDSEKNTPSATANSRVARKANTLRTIKNRDGSPERESVSCGQQFPPCFSSLRCMFGRWMERRSHLLGWRSAVSLLEATTRRSAKHLHFSQVFFDIAIGGKPAGRIIFELFSDITPKTAENFRVRLASALMYSFARPRVYYPTQLPPTPIPL